MPRPNWQQIAQDMERHADTLERRAIALRKAAHYLSRIPAPSKRGRPRGTRLNVVTGGVPHVNDDTDVRYTTEEGA